MRQILHLNAAVFSVVDWVLLRPLPYPASRELVRVFTAGISPATSPSRLTYDEFMTFGKATAFRESAAFTTAPRVKAGAGIDPVHVVVARVAGDLFATLGVSPDVGRAFSPEEMAAGTPAVVLGHGLWQRRFSEDRTIVGRLVTIDGAPHTVIGVMPKGRGYPSGPEVWRPLGASEREDNDRQVGSGGHSPRSTLDGDPAVRCHPGSRSGAWHRWRSERWAVIRVDDILLGLRQGSQRGSGLAALKEHGTECIVSSSLTFAKRALTPIRRAVDALRSELRRVVLDVGGEARDQIGSSHPLR